MIRHLFILFVVVFTVCEFSFGQVSEKLPTSSGKDQTYTGNLPNLSLDTRPEVLWKYQARGKNFWNVRSYDGVVIGIDRSGGLHALDSKSGRKLWQLESGSFISDLCFSADDNDLVIYSNANGINALSRKTGMARWSSKIPLGFGGPTVAGDVVFAGGRDGVARAFDLKTGKELWTHDFISDRPKDPPGFERKDGAGRDPARPQPASTDGKTFFFSVFDQCRVIALDVKTGKRKWGFQTKGWLYPRPSIDRNRLFIGSQDKHFYCVNKQTGKMIWKVATKSRIEAPGAISSNSVVMGSCDGIVRNINTEMGNEVWQYKLEKVKGRTAAIYCQPIISRTHVYVAAMEGQVYALNRKTGKLTWKFRPSPGSEINGQPQVEGNRLFVSTRTDGGTGESGIFAIGYPE